MVNRVNPTVAIIDSGIGGISILKQLIKKYNCGNYIYFADNQHMPYGNKSKKWVKTRINEIILLLQQKYKVDYIIIACNTASASIDVNDYENVEIMRFNAKKTYLATELTKENLKNINIISNRGLAKQIEKNIFNTSQLEKKIYNCVKSNNLNKLKSYVLGCTHYELVHHVFKKYCPCSNVINNSGYLIDDLCFEYTIKELNFTVIVSKNSESYRNKLFTLINE